MSDSVRPQRRQPTRLPRPWDSPSKNTRVGCHFLLQCHLLLFMKVKSESEVAQSCLTPSDPMDCSLSGPSVHGICQRIDRKYLFSFLWGRASLEGRGYPLQYSGLENSMDCIVHGVTKSRTQLSNFHFHFIWGNWQRLGLHLGLIKYQ